MLKQQHRTKRDKLRKVSTKNSKKSNSNTRFKIEKCAIPELWCGISQMPKYSSDFSVKYIRRGSVYDCLKKGIGTGKNLYKSEFLNDTSLQHIKYIGEYYDSQFSKYNIKSKQQLINKTKNLSSLGISKLLKKILVTKKGILDKRAYNSVILFLYKNGISNVPSCSNITKKI